MDITAKFAITILIGMSILGFLGEVMMVSQQEKSFEKMLSSSATVVEDIIKNNSDKDKASQVRKVENLSRLLAAIAPDAIAEFELNSLMSYAEVVHKDPDISYVAILSKDGAPLATVGKKDALSSE